MNHRFWVCIAAIFISLPIPTTYPADLDAEQKALAIIADFADKLCKSPPLQGGANALELTGSAKADLSEIVKKIIDLGIEGAAKYESTEYQGLLQKDLVAALKESRDCKLVIWRDLKDKLLPKKCIPPAPARIIERERIRVEHSGNWADHGSIDLPFGERCSDGFTRSNFTVQRIDGTGGHCVFVRWATDDPHDCNAIVHYGIPFPTWQNCRIIIYERGPDPNDLARYNNELREYHACTISHR